MEELRLQLLEAQKRAEKAEKSAEEERLAREQAQKSVKDERRAREEAESAREEAEAGRRGAEERSQDTTFAEYLQACRESLFQRLCVKTNKRLTTQGSIPAPTGKFCPQRLRHWDDFHEQQQRVFNEVHGAFPSSDRTFRPAIYLQMLGEEYCSKELASEADLAKFQSIAVEQQTTNILAALRKLPIVAETYQLGDNIRFENHANALKEGMSEELPPETPRRGRYTDQICVYKDDDGNAGILFVIEYKPPHKLSVANLQNGLVDMDVLERVVNRATIPSNEIEKAQYYAERLSTSAITQTYHYMIENGLEYSYLTTGEAFVFLRIDWDDKSTLYYHVTVPGLEPVLDKESGLENSQSAVAQVLSFCLMASLSVQQPQDRRAEADEELCRWEVDFDVICYDTPEEIRNYTPPTWSYRPSRHLPVKRSPHRTRARACQSGEEPTRSGNDADDSDHGSGDSSSSGPETPVRRQMATRQSKKTASKRNTQASKGPKEALQYCTHKCLLGIFNAQPFDDRCPNVTRHRAASKRHLSAPAFRALLREQLGETLDSHCEPLGKPYTRGAGFKLALTSHGYVLVGKGTIRSFIPCLIHETEIYRQLRPLQGKYVPVCLGSIGLVRRYYLDFEVRIVHMMLLSWAGEVVDDEWWRTPVLRPKVERIREEMRRLGVEHDDLKSQNILQDGQGKVMVIDFELATRTVAKFVPVKDTVKVLGEVSPNRRKRKAAIDEGASKRVKQ